MPVTSLVSAIIVRTNAYSDVFLAVLPVMVETVLKKILEHITEQCLICCDVGVACGARQDCNDPSSLIFPFQVSFLYLIWLPTTWLYN